MIDAKDERVGCPGTAGAASWGRCEKERGHEDPCTHDPPGGAAKLEAEKDESFCAGGSKWRKGRKVGRTLYVGDRLVGLVDDEGIADAIVSAMNGCAPNHRAGIAAAISREANRIYNKQGQDFPSNVLDVLAVNIRAGRCEDLTEPEDWMKRQGFGPKPR